MTAPVVKRGRVASKQLSGSGPTRKWDNEGNLGIMDGQKLSNYFEDCNPFPLNPGAPVCILKNVLTCTYHCGVCRRAARQLQLVDRPKLGGLMIDDAEDRYGGEKKSKGLGKVLHILAIFGWSSASVWI